MKNIDNDNYLTKMSANFSRYCCVKPRRRKNSVTYNRCYRDSIKITISVTNIVSIFLKIIELSKKIVDYCCHEKIVKEFHSSSANNMRCKNTIKRTFFFYVYKFTAENKKTKKDIHQASRNLRMPGTNLKTIKFNNI